MRRCSARTIRVLLFGVLPLLPSARAGAQDVPLADGPRFLLSPSADARPVEVDASRIAALGRKVSLTLDNVRLEDALDELSVQAGVRFVYVGSVLPLEKRVQFRSENITVATALTELLFGLRVDVVASGASQLALVRREQKPALQSDPGAIVGRVTEAESGSPIVNAQIAVDGQGRAVTNDQGAYRIDGVTPGRRTVTVTSIGYARASSEVEVSDSATVVVDFALDVSPSVLDEVVVTVTGEQRLRELGHVVGRIAADSLVKEAPVTNITELLNGRVSGLQVFTPNGLVGGDVTLQVRGQNSLWLSREPVVIVDGIRYTSGSSPDAQGPFSAIPTNRLNDLNPNDVESIEVVKGPSAATLYGTDAANGVIVITTKRGRPGPARWNAYAKMGTTAIPKQRYPDGYWGWGTATTSCTLERVAVGVCAQDSVTVLPNALNESALTIFGRQSRWEYGINVSGGQQDLRYYFSGDFERATGPVQLPPAIADSMTRARGVEELPAEQLDPNAFTKINLRANMTAALSERAEVDLTAGFTRSDTRTLTGASYIGAFSPTPDALYGTEGQSPASSFSSTSTEQVDRLLGSIRAKWRPASWVLMRATAGLDLTSSARYSIARRDEAVLAGAMAGMVGDDRTRLVATTADFNATASLLAGPLSFRTSAGAQYVRSLSSGLFSSGRDLRPGGESLGDAASTISRQIHRETVTLGSYLEQTIGLHDRFFITGALRVDGASAFGRDYDAAIYPKASLSWLISEEPFVPRIAGLDEFRMRYAFGTSGQQATPDMALPQFTAGQAFIGDTTTNAIALISLGNPALRPERVREHEFGFDAMMLGGRLRSEIIWYRRRTADQIVSVTLPPGLGSTFTNLGLTTQRGFELELAARLVDTPILSWDLTVRHGSHRTTLVDLGGAEPGFYPTGSFVEGYPLGARFIRPLLGYADANGDGLIATGEVQLGDTAVYAGEGTPPRSQTVSTAISLFQRRLRLSALLERRSGFLQTNGTNRWQCVRLRCRGGVDPNTPLAEQAEVAAMLASSDYVPLEPGDFTRLRELTVAVDLPMRWVHIIGAERAMLSLSGRNLALWTSFSGPDPESASVLGSNGVDAGPATNVPQSRPWTLRLDLSF